MQTISHGALQWKVISFSQNKKKKKVSPLTLKPNSAVSDKYE